MKCTRRLRNKRYPRVYTKNGMGRLCLAICGNLRALSRAQDGRLDELRTTLASLRAQSRLRIADTPRRHAPDRHQAPAPRLDRARLAAFGQTGDEDALNRELQVALLQCRRALPGWLRISPRWGIVDQVRCNIKASFSRSKPASE